jgi:hypothetical protein
MRAKFINEDIRDIFKPKSKKEIKKHFFDDLMPLPVACDGRYSIYYSPPTGAIWHDKFNAYVKIPLNGWNDKKQAIRDISNFTKNETDFPEIYDALRKIEYEIDRSVHMKLDKCIIRMPPLVHPVQILSDRNEEGRKIWFKIKPIN